MMSEDQQAENGRLVTAWGAPLAILLGSFAYINAPESTGGDSPSKAVATANADFEAELQQVEIAGDDAIETNPVSEGEADTTSQVAEDSEETTESVADVASESELVDVPTQGASLEDPADAEPAIDEGVTELASNASDDLDTTTASLTSVETLESGDELTDIDGQDDVVDIDSQIASSESQDLTEIDLAEADPGNDIDTAIENEGFTLASNSEDTLSEAALDASDITDPVIADAPPAADPVIADVTESVDPVIADAPPAADPVIADVVESVDPVIADAPPVADPVIADVPESVDPVIADAPPVADPVIADAPETVDPVIADAPPVADPVIADVPESVDPVIADAPPVADPVIADAPETVDPVIADAPPVADPVIADAPETVDPVIADAPPVADPVIADAPETVDPVIADAPPAADPETESAAIASSVTPDVIVDPSASTVTELSPKQVVSLADPVPSVSSDNETTKESAADKGDAKDNKPQKSFLGVGIRRTGTTRVTTLYGGSTAEKMGILIGDELVTVNNKKVSDVETLRKVLGTIKVGEKIVLQIRRNNEVYTVGPAAIGTRE